MTDDSRWTESVTRRRVLGALGAVGAASAAAGAGTMAFFRDTERSTDNTVSAGTLDLELGTTNALEIDVEDASPGFYETYTGTLSNAGSLSGQLFLGVTVASVSDGDSPESEPSYALSGGMRDELELKVLVDGERALPRSSLGTAARLGNPRRALLQTLDGGESVDFEVAVAVDSTATNEVQGDELAFALEFELRAVDPIQVGADYSTIQGAVDAADPGGVVHVPAGTYEESVEIATPAVQIIGDGTGDTIVDGAGFDRGIGVDANDVVLEGVTAKNAGQCVEVNADADGNSSRLSGVDLVDVAVEGADGRGLVVDHSDDCTLAELAAMGNGNDGVTLWYTHDTRVETLSTTGNGDNGVYVAGDNNQLLDVWSASGNGDEGVDVNWFDDSSRTTQRVLLDDVHAANNLGGEDVALHDNGTDDAAAANEKLLKNVTTEGSDVGLRLANVEPSEVRRVECSFPNGVVVNDGATDGDSS